MCAWIEQTAFSLWIRESLSLLAFPGILTLHTLALGILSGFSVVLDLRVLGVASGVSPRELLRGSRVFWGALWVTVLTGLALVIAYPLKALTNPVFYVKLVLFAIGLWAYFPIRREILGWVETAGSPFLPSSRLRSIAALSIASWAGAIVLGRLLAYTYSRLMT